MRNVARRVSILIVIILMFSACNLPANTPPTEQSNVLFTAAALTVQAQQTQSVPFRTPTLPLSAPTNTTAPLPTVATATRQPPAATATPLCDLARFIRDINIPDGSPVQPGASFTKTWRLENDGVCTWSGYSLIFDRGELMGGTPQTFGSVSPGQEVDVSVNFTAPTTPGSYRSYWRIRNSTGALIPVLGGTEGKSFFVDIKVVAPTSSGYDLYSRAPDANWGNGTDNFAFGGPDTDVRGFAMYRNAQRLEDGSSPAKVVETHPQWVDNGTITGLFPAYTVVSGEHFRAKLGFLAQADGTCGTGNVKFQLNYREAGVVRSLGEWADTCDGSLRDIDVDLTSLAGKTVQFQLAVLANGPAGQDWAVWVAPQVRIP